MRIGAVAKVPQKWRRAPSSRAKCACRPSDHHVFGNQKIIACRRRARSSRGTKSSCRAVHGISIMCGAVAIFDRRLARVSYHVGRAAISISAPAHFCRRRLSSSRCARGNRPESPSAIPGVFVSAYRERRRTSCRGNICIVKVKRRVLLRAMLAIRRWHRCRLAARIVGSIGIARG